MPKFHFQLEGVLRARRGIEKQRQTDLAEVAGRLQELEVELRQLDIHVQAVTADVRDNRLVGRLDMKFIAAHRRYVLAMQRRAVGIAEKMAVVHQDVEAARTALAQAATERKIIEKLREKQHERWLAEQSKKEMAQQDEVSMQLAYAKMVQERQWADDQGATQRGIPEAGEREIAEENCQ